MTLPTITKYIIQKGDTLYKIARKFNTTITAISKLNPNINPYILYEGQLIIIANKEFNLYENFEYNVRFKYPFHWKKIEDTRFEGDSGFFHVSAISSIGNIEDVCKSEACHRLLPYGTTPSLHKMHHMGQDACIIIPSEDQSPDMKKQGAFIIEYPFKLEIQGEKYNFFLLWASKDLLVEIIKTLKFIQTKKVFKKP